MASPIRPDDLPETTTVNPNSAIIVDDGVTVRKATPIKVVDAAIPLASQLDAEAGLDNEKRMSSLRVKQAIDAQAATIEAVNARVPYAELASTAPGGGAALVGYQQEGLSAVVRTALKKLQERVSVFDFMTTEQIASAEAGDLVEDVTAPIQAAIDSIIAKGGGSLYFPKGIYKITAPLIVERGVTNISVSLIGEGMNSTIRQTGVDQDAIVWSQTRYLNNCGMRDIQIIADATAGHAINIGFGVSTNFFLNVEARVFNPTKHVWYGEFLTGGGIYDSLFQGGAWWCAPDQPTNVAGFRVIVGGTFFNGNRFSNLRGYYAEGEQFFKVTTEAGSSYALPNTSWQNINFQICRGGGIYFDSLQDAAIREVSFWDAQGAYTGHLIHMAAGAGFESSSVIMEGVTRNGDSLAPGIQDIKIDSGTDTVLINCYTISGISPRYDFGNKRVTTIGRFVGTVINASGHRIISDGTGMLKFPGATAYLNNYDEGTWTATLTGAGSAPTTPVTATGQWTRVGRLMTVHAVFSAVDTTGAAGDLSISGLPVPAATSGRTVGSARMAGFGTAPAVSYIIGSSVWFYEAANATARITHTGAGAGKTLDFSATYEV